MRLISLGLLMLLTSCASAPPQEPQYYLLRSTAAATGANADPATVSLGRVRVAAYIDQSGIVVETAPSTLRPARYHQWAEPLRDSLRPFLAVEISAALGRPVRAENYADTEWREQTDTLIDLQIDTLHGTDDGDALLVARWALIEPKQRMVLSEHHFERQAPLSSSGYGALVAAEQSLLRELAVAVADSLKRAAR